MRNISLSVCLIVKNEEAMLTDCLKSVAGIASEIVVVDTGSEDSTIDIAKVFNCKIIRAKWEHDFAKARNIALDNARGTHILVIDADERLVNPHLLIPTLQNSSENVGGWLIKVVSKALRADGGADTYISNLLRLFINHHSIRYEGIIHEQIINSVIDGGFTFKNSPLEITHLGYNYQLERMQQKQLRNLELLNIAIESDPNNPYNLYNRAKTYLSLREVDKAEADTKRVLEIAGQNSSIRPQALNYGGIVSAQLGNYEEAITRANASLVIVPEQSFAYYILGEAYSYLGDYEQAANAYINMQEMQHKSNLIAYIVGDYYLPPEQIHFKIGKSYVGMKLYDKALAEFTSGNRINPNEPNNIVGLANIYFSKQDFANARIYLNKALSIDPNRQELKTYLKQLDDAEQSVKLRNERIHSNKPIDTTGINPIARNKNPKLALSMIVKNEEQQLSGCLESVREIVDEIIIVDTGSTDRTIEIAQMYGAKIYHFPWIDDFSAARNESLKHCTGEWILYLDADERITPESVQVIRDLITYSSDEMAAYICTIESLHLQIDGKTEMHRGGYPRLFRNYGYPTIQFQGRVHEQITPSLFALRKTVDFSDVVILHLGYDTSREVMEQKVRRNYSMLIQHVQDEPLNAYAWFQLGQTLAQMRLFEQAESSIRMSIKIGELSNPVYASAAATLAQIVGAQKKLEEALYWANQSLERAPNQVFALFLKASALLHTGKPAEAVVLFEEVLRRNANVKGVPRSGFDVVLDEDVIKKAIDKCKSEMQKANA